MKRTIGIPKMGKEVVLEAASLSNPEARFLVANYYDAQRARKRADMQLRHMGDKEKYPRDPATGEPYPFPQVLQYWADNTAYIEDQVKKALQQFADKTIIGQWCQSHDGIGPVITAGLLAHLDITKAPTAGHFFTFAGLNPEKRTWGEGEKRPYNADLRQICWHLGQCFKRISYKESAVYGHLYQVRKRFLVERNLAGYNAERAKSYRTQSDDVRKTLKAGLLPDGNIDSQACNYAAKIFLSHLHGVMYWDKYRKAPPKPYAIDIMGHAHEIPIPNMGMFPGFREAYYGAKAA